MNWSNPRRTFESVVDELAEGLGDGTIVLSERDEELPLEAERDFLNLQRTSIGQSANEPREECESLQDTKPLRRKTAQPFDEAPIRPTMPTPKGVHGVVCKDMYIRGEIKGETLFIDGTVEGSVSGMLVTIGPNGQVNANIAARDIIIYGKVRGHVSAIDRVDIRAEGALSGDIAAARISIEDGAYFKGGIDILKPEALKFEDDPNIELNARERDEVHRFA